MSTFPTLLVIATLALGGSRVSLAQSSTADITWRNIGPGGGGWIQSIATDPSDPERLHLGCDVGGYYASADLGGTWLVQNTGLQDCEVQVIAVTPAKPGTILLGLAGGVYKSTDAGKTWTLKRQGFPAVDGWRYTAPIGAITFDPAHSNILYAGIGRPREGKEGAGAIYKSEDTGETWRQCDRGDIPADAIIGDIKVAPDGSFILCASNRGPFRSDDSGATWKCSNVGLPHLECGRVVIAPSFSDVCYVTVATLARDKDPFDGGVYRSADRGRTWTRKSKGLADGVGPKSGPMQFTSGYREIVVSPKDPNTVYAGSTAWVSSGVYKSTDGGDSWKWIGPAPNVPGTDYGWIRQWGPTVECMAISAQQPDTVVFGTSGQMYLTRDGGKTWQQRYCRELPDGRFTSTGLEVTCLNSITFDPRQKERLYCGYYDIGLLISKDMGQTFLRSSQGMKNDGNTFTVVADPAVPGRLWAGTGEWAANVGDVCRSSDGGATWTVVGKPETGLPNGQTKTLLLDPTSSPDRRRLFVTVNGAGVFASEDNGTTWKAMNEGLPKTARGSIAGLIMDPKDGKHLRCLLAGRPDSGIYETTDGAASWCKVSAQDIFGDCKQLVADPKDSNALYVCLRATAQTPGGLWGSRDSGKTFAQLYDYHFAQCMAVSPRDSKVLYLGLMDNPYHDQNETPGFLVTRDGGKTWREENSGLTLRHVASITVSPHDPRVLVVGTSGNGIFLGRDEGK